MPDFDGATYDQAQDGARLKGQLARVRECLQRVPGMWWTLQRLKAAVGGASEAGVSARLRDLRKRQHGGRKIERRRAKDGSGLWLYRMVPEPEQKALRF